MRWHADTCFCAMTIAIEADDTSAVLHRTQGRVEIVAADDASGWRSDIGSQRFKVKREEGRLLRIMLAVTARGPRGFRVCGSGLSISGLGCARAC